MTLDDAVALCSERNLNVSDVAVLCDNIHGSKADVLNVLALDVAKRYSVGNLGFDIADHLMNNIFAYGIKVEELPEPMLSIYLAFDAGEYVADGDCQGTTPKMKYTRPKIEEVLSGESAS
jgi:hypothetical protein